MRRNKGFTRLEILLISAGIVILILFSLPFLLTQIEKSRESADLSNVRSAYTKMVTTVLTDDRKAEYNGETIYQDGIFKVKVRLSQWKIGWQSNEENVEVSGINALRDKNTLWFDEPMPGGYCEIVYENEEMHLYWAGGLTDYISILKNSVFYNGDDRYVLNSACTMDPQIKAVNAGMISKEFREDIAAWTAVRTSLDPEDFYYLVTFADLSELEDGEKVPVLARDPKGEYSIGYVTVSAVTMQDGTETNVIACDKKGNYPALHPAEDENGEVLNESFDPEQMIDEKVVFRTRAEAQYAYREFFDSYKKSKFTE